MANDVIEKDGILEITGINADWDYKASKPANWADNPRLSSITFVPGAASDKLVVRQKEAGGPRRMEVSCADANDQRIKYFHGQHVMPYIDEGNSTLSADHVVIIELWRDA